jgi:hypothetical protein
MVNIAFGVEFFRPFFWLLKIYIRRILFIGKDVRRYLVDKIIEEHKKDK